MGFLTFGKKDKNSLDDLDIPPPPPLENFDSSMDKKLNFQNQEAMPPMMPPLQPQQMQRNVQPPQQNIFPPPSQAKMDEPSFDIPDFKLDAKMPDDFSDFGKKEEIGKADKPSYEQLFKPLPTKMEIPKKQKVAELFPGNYSDSKQVFIEVGKYKNLLKDFAAVKKSLKQCDDELGNVVGVIDEEEKTFSKLHDTLLQVEEKLTQLEKGIFSQ
jgi:hypothetical protein